MKLNIRTALFAIVVVVLLYVLYAYMVDSNKKRLTSNHDARQQMILSPNSLPSGRSIDYTYSFWIYVNDWNYRIGQEKVIFARYGSDKRPAPSVSLDANTNNINVNVDTYSSHSGTSGALVSNSCSITDVPLQRWTHILVTTNNRALDIYVDGKLVRTCVLQGVPKTYPSAPVTICPDGGFSGYISNFDYIASSTNPTEAYDLYKKGFGGMNLTALFDKYRIKFAFMENNKEVSSLEI